MRAPDWTEDQIRTLLPWVSRRMPLSVGRDIASQIGRSQSAVNVKIWQMRRSGGIKIKTNEGLSAEKRLKLTAAIRNMPAQTVEAERAAGRVVGVSDRTVREYMRRARETGGATAPMAAQAISRRCLCCDVPFEAASRFLRLCAPCRVGSQAAA